MALLGSEIEFTRVSCKIASFGSKSRNYINLENGTKKLARAAAIPNGIQKLLTNENETYSDKSCMISVRFKTK